MASNAAEAMVQRITAGEYTSEPLEELSRDEVTGALRCIIDKHRQSLATLGAGSADGPLGALAPESAFARMRVVDENPDTQDRCIEFARRISQERRTDAELYCLANHVAGVIAACRRAVHAVQVWSSRLTTGCTELDDENLERYGKVVQAGARLLDTLRINRYRLTRSTELDKDLMSGDLCRQVKVPGTQLGAHAWERVRNPQNEQQFYSLREFVINQTSLERDPELHKLLQGDVVDGIADKVVKWLRNSPHTAFPTVRMHRHSFAFTDGIYIGFMHDSPGAECGEAFEPLWAAIASGEVLAMTNFAEGGANAARRFAGHMAHSYGPRRIAADVFVTHEHARRLLPREFTVTRYIGQPAAAAMRVGDVAPSAWASIETPSIDFVLKWQFGDPGVGAAERDIRVRNAEERLACDDLDKMYRDVAGVWWAVMGRLLFPADQYSSSGPKAALNCKLDTAQIAPMMIGKARCGKSQLGLTVAELLPPHEVGNLSNRSEPMFWGQALYDKRLITALEVKKSLNFDPANLQNMVSGEQITVARKNQDPWMGNWQAPVVFAANEMPDCWEDGQGQISNRLLFFNFDYFYSLPHGVEPPFTRDLHVAVHESPEVAAMVRKLYCSYMLQADAHGGKPNYFTDLPAGGTDDNVASLPQAAFDACALPKPFFMWRARFRQDMNSLRAFFFDPAHVVGVDIESATRALAARAGISTVDARIAVDAVVHIAPADMKGAAEHYVREHGADTTLRVNQKTVKDAIATHCQGYIRTARGEVPSRVINNTFTDDGAAHQILVPPTGGSVKYYYGVALRRGLDQAIACAGLAVTPKERNVVALAMVLVGDEPEPPPGDEPEPPPGDEPGPPPGDGGGERGAKRARVDAEPEPPPSALEQMGAGPPP